MSLLYYEEKFRNVRPDRSSGHAKPHKVCLLLAVMDLIENGYITENRIYLNEELLVRFTFHFNNLKQGNDKNDLYLPFFHLKNSNFWDLCIKDGKRDEFNQNPRGSRAFLERTVSYAFLDNELFELMKSDIARQALIYSLSYNIENSLREQILKPANVWSWFECEVIAADYFTMLRMELRGEKFNKAAHNRMLQQETKRTKGSIERKHMNISAILHEMGMPFIDGYKPYSNYQTNILPDVIGAHLAADNELALLIDSLNKRTINFGDLLRADNLQDILSREVDVPIRKTKKSITSVSEKQSTYTIKKRDYLELNARNQSLGLAGEMFVLEFERARLQRAGKVNLADRIEHISVDDDSQGFDIRSFDENGKDRLIEVKTTSYSRYAELFITRKELEVSQAKHHAYHLYRVFNFRAQERAKFFTVSGDLSRNFDLCPELYKGSI